MTWVAVASAGAGLLGGFMKKKSGDDSAKVAAEMAKADREWQEKMYGQSLQDNRPNQVSDFGSLTWDKDPNTGAMTQTNKLNPMDAQRLQDFRGVQQRRMDALTGANGAHGGFSTSGIDWGALGHEKQAAALGLYSGGSAGGAALAGPAAAPQPQGPAPAPAAPQAPAPAPAAPAQDPAALAAALRKQQEEQLLAQSQSSGGGAMPWAGGANQGGGA